MIIGSTIKNNILKKTEKKTKLGNNINRIYNKNQCVIHLIDTKFRSEKEKEYDSDSDDEDKNGEFITKFITDQHPELWDMMKRGDLIEDISVSGYRCDGRYYVETEHSQENHIKIIQNGLIVRDLYRGIDMYGTLPPSFHTITDFPIDYFENIITNNTLYPRTKSESYWHGLCLVALDLKKLKLNKLTNDNIFHKKVIKYSDFYKSSYNHFYVYAIVTFKKCNYLILQCIDGENKTPKNGDKEIKNVEERFISYFNDVDDNTYGAIPYNSFSMSDKKHIECIALEESVDIQNILIID